MKAVFVYGNEIRKKEFSNVMAFLKWFELYGGQVEGLEVYITPKDKEVTEEFEVAQATIRSIAPKLLNVLTYLDKGDEYASKAYSIAFQTYKYIDYMLNRILTRDDKANFKTVYSLAVLLNTHGMNFVMDFIDYIIENSECVVFDMKFIHEWFKDYIMADY